MALFSELSPSDQENLSGGLGSAPPAEGPGLGWGDQEEGSCSGYERPRGFILWPLGEQRPLRGGLRGIIPRLGGGVRGSSSAFDFSSNLGSMF
jgi:hypothetical protein